MSILRDRRGTDDARITVTSLVDVTMTVLIMFILLVPLMEQGVDVSLPPASPMTFEQPDYSAVISMQQSVDEASGITNGVLYCNDREMDRLDPFGALKKEIRLLKERETPTNKLEVIIRVDRRFRYGNVLELVNHLKEIGVDTSYFATETTGDKK
ncbi:biopolymer transporter ExbD [bacterium]|nr:biopolymer transporter ExbD [bacterium]